MGVLSKISGRFGIEGTKSAEEPTVNQAVQESTPDHCPSCNGHQWWLPRGQTTWRCESCQPPPSEALVGSRRSDEPSVVESVTVTCCVPWCDRCGCWQGRETTWSDGRLTTQCRSCGSLLPEWPVAQDIKPEAQSGRKRVRT